MITCCQPRLRDKLSSQTFRTLRVLRWRGICGEALLRASGSRVTPKHRPSSVSSSAITASSSSSLLCQRRYDSSSSSDSTSDKKVSINTKDSKQPDEEKSGKKDKHKPLLLSQSNTTRLKNDKIRQKQQQAEDDRQESEAIRATFVSSKGKLYRLRNLTLILCRVERSCISARSDNCFPFFCCNYHEDRCLGERMSRVIQRDYWIYDQLNRWSG